MDLVVDGANIAMLRRKGRRGDLGFLLDLLDAWRAAGLEALVVVDASLRHRLEPEDQALLEERLEAGWIQVPKGTDADTVVLAEADRLGADIVSNDRFRDHRIPDSWTGAFLRVDPTRAVLVK